MTISIPKRIKERFLEEILSHYSEGQLSAGRTAEMLGISKAEFYQILSERKIRLPEELNKSLLRESSSFQRS